MISKYVCKKGDIFGNWTVISDNHKNLSASRARHYLCTCICGLTEKYVTATSLFNKKSKGCKKCSMFSGIESLSGTYLAVIKKGARLRNIEFLVDLEYLYKVFLKQEKKCALTNMDITLHRNYSQGHRKEQTASVDRIDSKKGYVEGNIQWIHKDVNIMKNRYTQEYFVEICKKIAEHENNNNR